MEAVEFSVSFLGRIRPRPVLTRITGWRQRVAESEWFFVHVEPLVCRQFRRKNDCCNLAFLCVDITKLTRLCLVVLWLTNFLHSPTTTHLFRLQVAALHSTNLSSYAKNFSKICTHSEIDLLQSLLKLCGYFLAVSSLRKISVFSRYSEVLSLECLGYRYF